MSDLFNTEQRSPSYDFSRFSSIESLLKEFLMDCPGSSISCRYFRSNTDDSKIAGMCCQTKDNDLIENLLGFLDIPASMDGLTTTIVNLNANTYLMIYDRERIHEHSVRNLRFHNVVKIC